MEFHSSPTTESAVSNCASTESWILHKPLLQFAPSIPMGWRRQQLKERCLTQEYCYYIHYYCHCCNYYYYYYSFLRIPKDLETEKIEIENVSVMSHLQFSRAILSRECATKSRDKVACAATVQLHAATLSHKHGLNNVSFRIIQSPRPIILFPNWIN